MTKTLPSLFLSHGAPDILLSEHEALSALRNLGARFPRPRAIIIVSAHWIGDPVGITAGVELRTIHDFGGFPDSLYAVRYPARGDDALSAEVARRLRKFGCAARLDERRGLDHGAWVPLLIMYPRADIPVVQVSLPAGSVDAPVRLGAALAPLRRQEVLVIGSGGSTHNLRALRAVGNTDDWAIEFERWLRETVEDNRFDRLVTPAEFPATFHRAHPTLEHYAPLLVAWAAGNRHRPGRRIHHSFSYANLGMSIFEFGTGADSPSRDRSARNGRPRRTGALTTSAHAKRDKAQTG